MKQLVIFDLDGTLLNTINDLGTATNYALAECGYPTHELAAYPFFVGNGVTRLLTRALPEGMKTEQNVVALRRKFMEYYGEHNTDTTHPYDGIPELLADLQALGVRLAVASNKYQSAVDKLISHFFPNIRWAAIEGQKEDYPVKPDPSIVFDILSKNPTPKSDVLYIGDSGVDMETARRACVESVGVTWGFRPVAELREYHADHIATIPAQILDFVKDTPDGI